MPDTDDTIQNESSGADTGSEAAGQSEDLESKVDRLLADMDAACDQLKSELEAHDAPDEHSLEEVMAAGGALDDEGESVTEGAIPEEAAPEQPEAEAPAEAGTEPESTPEPEPEASEAAEEIAPEPESATPAPADGDAAQLDEQLAEMLDAAVAEERAATEEDEPGATDAAAELDNELDAELEGLAAELDSASSDDEPEPAGETRAEAPAAALESELDDELAELSAGFDDAKPEVAESHAEAPEASEPVAESAPEPHESDEPTHEVVTAADPAPGRDAGAERREPKPAPKTAKRELEPLRAEGRFKYAILAWLYAKRYAPPAAGFVMRQMQAAWRQAEPKLGLAVRTLSKPLEDRPKTVRDSVGWLALWTMFNAVVVWGFVLFIRTPPAPPVTTAPVQLREDQIPQDPGRVPDSGGPESAG